jgi:catalase
MIKSTSDFLKKERKVPALQVLYEYFSAPDDEDNAEMSEEFKKIPNLESFVTLIIDDDEYDDDYYSQPGDLFRLMPADEQQLLFENTARAMGDSELFIKQRHTRNCYKADPAYGAGVAKALGIDLQEALKE